MGRAMIAQEAGLSGPPARLRTADAVLIPLGRARAWRRAGVGTQ